MRQSSFLWRLFMALFFSCFGISMSAQVLDVTDMSVTGGVSIAVNLDDVVLVRERVRNQFRAGSKIVYTHQQLQLNVEEYVDTILSRGCDILVEIDILESLAGQPVPTRVLVGIHQIRVVRPLSTGNARIVFATIPETFVTTADTYPAVIELLDNCLGGDGGDNWGSQVVITDSTLVGDGTADNPLGIDSALMASWGRNIYNTSDTIEDNLRTVTLLERVLEFKGTDDGGGKVPFRIEVTGNEPDFQVWRGNFDSVLIRQSDVEYNMHSTAPYVVSSAERLVLYGQDSVQIYTPAVTAKHPGILGINDMNTVRQLQGSSDGDVITWQDGGWQALPAAPGGDDWGSQVVQHDATLSGNGTAGSPLKVDTAFIATINDVRPGGSNTQVQFNDSNVFGGDADYTWNKTDNQLTITQNANSSALAAIRAVNSNTGTSAQTRLDFFNNSGSTPEVNGFTFFLTGTNYPSPFTRSAGFYLYEPGSVIFGTNAAERMRVTSGGDVGIGLNNPGSRLHVKGPGTTSGSYSAIFEKSDGTDVLAVRDDGRVGVNTASPSAQFHAVAAASTSAFQFNLSNGASFQGTALGNLYSLGYTCGSLHVGNNAGLFLTNTGTASAAIGFVTGTSSSTWYVDNVSGQTGTMNLVTAGYDVMYLRKGDNRPGNLILGGVSSDKTYNNASLLSRNRWDGAPAAVFAKRTSGTTADILQVTDEAISVAYFRVLAAGGIGVWATNTAAGTTGNQTINRASGTVNFAAGATSLTVTNSLVTTASLVFAEVRTNDATAYVKNVVPAAGSFTINLGAAATAETSVGFFVIN